MPDFFSDTWCGLDWTKWVPLDAPAKTFRQVIPTNSGTYRIRASGGLQLAYIGQTGRSLRSRLGELARPVYQAQMPFNDPHTAAPNLWAYRVEDGFQYQCSVAPVTLDNQARHGLEDMLLWRHRLEFGQSTLCNHGRFHPQYTHPSNRKAGRPGTKLPPDQSNPASGPSLPPLQPHADFSQPDWMTLSWSQPLPLASSDVRQLPPSPGVYKLLDPGAQRLLYVGETNNLRNRLNSHGRNTWDHFDPFFSYHRLPDDTLPHQLHEYESDLLGAHFAAFNETPVFQYGRH